MIANSASPYPEDISHPFTLNDLRVQNTVPDVPSSRSALALAGVVVAAILAIGAFLWLDPLHWFTPTETSPPTQATVPSGDAAPPTESQPTIAPSTPDPAARSVEAPIAPEPAAQAPQSPAPAVQPRAANIKPDSRRNPAAKTNTNTRIAQANTSESTAPQALTRLEETTATPALSTKPEERADAPIVPKVGDDTRNVPKPAATNDQAPVPAAD